MRLAISILLLTTLFDASLQAQGSAIAADRPGFADGPGIVPLRHVQIEFGLAFEEEDGSLLSAPTLVRFGVAKSLEVRLESDILRVSRGRGELAPIAVGMKLQFHGGHPPLAVLASVPLPTGSDPFEGELRLVSDVPLGRGFSLVPNVGVAAAESGPLNAILAASLEKECRSSYPFVDFEVRSNDGDLSIIGDGGIAWIVRFDLQLDVAAGVRVAGHESSEWFMTAGVSRRF